MMLVIVWDTQAQAGLVIMVPEDQLTVDQAAQLTMVQELPVILAQVVVNIQVRAVLHIMDQVVLDTQAREAPFTMALAGQLMMDQEALVTLVLEVLVIRALVAEISVLAYAAKRNSAQPELIAEVS